MEFEHGTKVPETDRATIEAELNRLLRERRFSGASRLSTFLRYIVKETLDGRGERIKAYTVGVDALGKPDTFDAQNDPSVRVLAYRLRKALSASYKSNCRCRVFVELKVGKYRPEFFKVTNEAKEEVDKRYLNADQTEAVPGRLSPEHSASPVRKAHRKNIVQKSATVDDAGTEEEDSSVSLSGCMHGTYLQKQQAAFDDVAYHRQCLDDSSLRQHGFDR